MKPIDNWNDDQKQIVLQTISDWVEEYNVRDWEQAAQSDDIQISWSILVTQLADIIWLWYED